MASSSSNTDIKYEFTPAAPEPGDDYDKFRERALNAMASSDERGWSLADHLLGTDEGGPGGPPMPAGAGAAKALQAFRSRQKNSYKVLTKHITDSGHLTEMANNHFQNGRAAWLYLEQSCQAPVNAIRLRKLNKDWDDIDIVMRRSFDNGVTWDEPRCIVDHNTYGPGPINNCNSIHHDQIKHFIHN